MVADGCKAYIAGQFGPRTRPQLLARQASLWRKLSPCLGRAPALAAYTALPFNALPVVDIAQFRADFEGFNTVNLTYAQAIAAAQISETGQTGDLPDDLPDGLNAGFSTGTGGGTRGLFVTSATERAVYGGYLAGKLMTPFELAGVKRIAVCLRAPSRLYERRGMRFFGLQDEGRDAAIRAYDPDVLIAPSQVLLELAAHPQGLRSLRHLYYGAETLNATERAFIEQGLGRRPDPIYQATEGFLGAPCRLGTLHLNEDSFIIETETLGQGRFRPIITDLMRRTQLLVRLRLDDVLRATVCACGSPNMAVHPVEGRVADIWCWNDRTVFPGDVEAVVQPHVPANRQWTATGHAGGIDFACEDEADATGVEAALRTFGKPLTRQVYDRATDVPKRRHVRWRP